MMCAIAGILGLPFDAQILEKMFASMAHRGPDGNGSYMALGCCLLHTRLAIVDPSGGAQPMTAAWENEEYVITYNGELYNTEEIRAQLVDLGHTFRSHSDTEVVLHSYCQWKERCLDKFNGIFAFGIWEKKRRRLFLARDRMGVKPLFYTRIHDGFLFSSEIKTLLQYPDVKRELDGEGVAQLMLVGPGRIPGSGVLKDLYELMPGCCGWWEKGAWHWNRYWKIRDREHTDSFSETLDQVRFLVTDAIKRQMVSDVPLGTFLSGGLDSSIITAICAGELAQKGQRLKTFSLDYENNEKYFVPEKFQPNSDRAYIELMQQTLHTDHNLTILHTEQLLQALQDATRARDLPGMADVDFSLLLFCRQIRGEVKMALSGECADEIFGGYPWFRDPQVRARSGFPWAQNTVQRGQLLHKSRLTHMDPLEYVQDLYQTSISQCDIRPGVSTEERRMKQLIHINQEWFMQTLLDRKDRMSMASGLEVRVPFCDYRIAEYLYAVPWEMKDYTGVEKGLLRKAMEGILPEPVLWRKKSPYPKTYDPHYLELNDAMLQNLLERKDAPIFQLVDRDQLRTLLRQESVWPWYGQLMRLPQTIAYMLQVNFWLEFYGISVV